MKRFFAPQMHYLEMDKRIGMSDTSHITKETSERLSALLNLIKQIEPTKDGEMWNFWVVLPRGEIEDFGDYDELHEMGEYSSYEEFERDWKEWFPKEKYWYEITVVEHDGYVAIIVNNSAVLNINPHDAKPGYMDYTDFIQFLIDEVSAIIKGLKDGSYNKEIQAALPMDYRMGVIKSNILKTFVPSIRDEVMDGLTVDEVMVFVKYSTVDEVVDYINHPEKISSDEQRNNIDFLYANLKEDFGIDRQATMTANDYYMACAICYKAAQYEGLEGLSSKEMYRKFADDRDGRLCDVDAESKEEFDKWCSGDLYPDEPYANSSHKWEIVAGSTHTRIHLYVHKDEKGYYYLLSGGLHSGTTDVVRMYNALKEGGLPIFLLEHKTIRNKLLFLDNIGIIPIYNERYQFWYGGFPQKDILTYVKLSELELTEENYKLLSRRQHGSTYRSSRSRIKQYGKRRKQ